MLTSAELDKFTEDGTVNKWLADFDKMFQEFGTVKNPLPPEQYYEAKLFARAKRPRSRDRLVAGPCPIRACR
ncbi:hypothetical protein [Rhizobium mayense]|uniref:Uncharacterized protein n=1 Tax=Rhizobium mayense TaxID=1312184 RepID=A0ABT7JS54_9HYPH|nr:hypothetical protein [Rhizobium mayense]MDL2398003.1 hypothetical protein [Rhizobium mayense]